MPYATLDDLIERAGETEIRQIADRDRDGAIDADVVEAALTDADNLVNGYVAAKYTVPLASVPAVEICSDRSAAGMMRSARETR